MAARRVELTLLGQALVVRTEEDAAYLQGLVREIEARVTVHRRAGTQDPLKGLALAALELADELHDARQRLARHEGDVGKRLGALAALLEGVTARSGA